MASRASRWRRPLLVAAIVLIALLLRLRAAFLLPVDFDEPTYLGIASQYTSALQAGDLWAVATLDRNIEHPALVKLLYGVELAIFAPPSPGSGGAWGEVALQLARGLSVLFGSGQVLLLALLHPLAGAALAVHTMSIKYTSQAYLEAVP
ncbi:MAG: transcriptional regulator, partial [Chloroflexi bacterium]|nr:transcriptional regulator [Chloroflexota bacterium]